MPWMSRLFGPLSETMSSVSCRPCARAGENTAGAETAPPAASAVMDFRKSRRFISVPVTWPLLLSIAPQGSCQLARAMEVIENKEIFGNRRACLPPHFKRIAYKGGHFADSLGGAQK